MELKYKNHSRNGLKNNHVYVAKIFPPKNKLYLYTIQFLFDATNQEEIDLELRFCKKRETAYSLYNLAKYLSNTF